MSFLGIDCGTTGCKVVAFDRSGSPLAAGYVEYRAPETGSLKAELDAAAIILRIHSVIREAVTQIKADPVEAVAAASMGEAFVPVSSDRRVLAPSMLGFDPRGREYLPELRDALSDDDLYVTNGNTWADQFSITKMMWIKRERPDLYERTHKFLLWSGFVAYMLGAEPCVDLSLANRTLLFDLESADWSERLLSVAGIDRSKLPDVVPAGSPIGTISQPVAEVTGLQAGTPVVAGTHDQCANSVGCGSIRGGDAMLGMGTFFVIVPVFEFRPNPSVMRQLGLNTEHHAVANRYVSFFYNMTGAIVQWFRDTFAADLRGSNSQSRTPLYDRLFDEMPDKPSEVLVLPGFSALGPPTFRSDTRGLLAGMTLGTGRGEVLKGIVDSGCYALKHCLNGLAASSVGVAGIRAVGGGSRSRKWVQTCADILGVPITTPAVTEAGALGSALLAAVGSGAFGGVDEAVAACVAPGRTFEPRHAHSSEYAERCARHQELDAATAEVLSNLSQM